MTARMKSNPGAVTSVTYPHSTSSLQSSIQLLSWHATPYVIVASYVQYYMEFIAIILIKN